MCPLEAVAHTEALVHEDTAAGPLLLLEGYIEPHISREAQREAVGETDVIAEAHREEQLADIVGVVVL